MVTGTIGILEAAAARGLIDLADALAKLRQTNARLEPGLIEGALERSLNRKQ